MLIPEAWARNTCISFSVRGVRCCEAAARRILKLVLLLESLGVSKNQGPQVRVVK